MTGMWSRLSNDEQQMRSFENPDRDCFIARDRLQQRPGASIKKFAPEVQDDQVG